ncbi:hypothetical protein ANN_20543, partial [Periplaneta americana]
EFPTCDSRSARNSQSTVSRIVKKISTLTAQLRPHYVKFPSRQEGRNNSLHFYQTSRYPEVLGANDGTHFPIMGPGATVVFITLLLIMVLLEEPLLHEVQNEDEGHHPNH